MKRSFLLSLLLVLLFSVTSCRDKGKLSLSVAPTSLCNEETAMAHFLSNPDRAIIMLDSAVIAGNLTPQRAEYLKAIVEYNGKEEFETALKHCQQLIDEESWKSLPDSEDVVSYQVDLYRLMASICTTTGNYLPAARYAQQGAELSHGIEKLRGDEADFLSRIGHVMTLTGQYEEAIAFLRRSESLSAADDRWSSLISYLNNAKKLYSVLKLTERYDEAKQVIRAASARLQELPANIHEVRFAPDGMLEDPQALEEFIQFYQISYDCSLVDIFVCQQQTDSALFYLNLVYANPRASKPSNTIYLVDPLIGLGRYDEAEQLIAAIRDCYGNDTLNLATLELKKQGRRLASRRGNYRLANQMADDILDLTEQTITHQMQMSLAYTTAEYHLQDERHLREDAETRLLWIFIGIIVFFVLGIVALTIWYIRRLIFHQHVLENKFVLAEKRLAAVGQETSSTLSRQTDTTEEKIFARALEIVEKQGLYRDSSLDIEMLSQLVMTNRHYLSDAINSQSGMNFRTWIAHFRVEQAKKLLRENPSITGLQLATACGYDNRVSLYRHFKHFEGMNITEWLAREKGKSS